MAYYGPLRQKALSGAASYGGKSLGGKVMGSTNVKPEHLNYHRTAENYDVEVLAAIPHHHQLHRWIRNLLQVLAVGNALDLGCGTGLTSQLLLDEIPSLKLTVVDFDDPMLNIARGRLGPSVNYIQADYAELELGSEQYDLVVSVIGMHHQTDEGKRKMFRKIFQCLKPGGTFIFGDLMTYRDKRLAALNQAKHFAHLVKHARDEETLMEWAHHHLFLNLLAPVEDQIKWLREVGFKANLEFMHINTALICAIKS